MDQQLRHLPLDPGGHEAAYRAEAALLNGRIALVALVVMAELAALTAALDAWAEGHASVLFWILGFQLVSFLLALSISTAVRPSAAQPIPILQLVPAEAAAE